jgi:hypothetical protein
MAQNPYENGAPASDNLLNSDTNDPDQDNPLHVVGEMVQISERYKQVFIDRFELDSQAKTSCVRRLITGEMNCPHEPLSSSVDDNHASHGPPHSPPVSGYENLWLDHSNQPVVYGMHIPVSVATPAEDTNASSSRWFEIYEFASTWGLDVSVQPVSWQVPGRCVHVVLFSPEKYRSKRGSTANR